jgi:hypothetical protein
MQVARFIPRRWQGVRHGRMRAQRKSIQPVRFVISMERDETVEAQGPKVLKG